jgi:hypothetical protein
MGDHDDLAGRPARTGLLARAGSIALALLCACNPNAFDQLTDSARAVDSGPERSDAGESDRAPGVNAGRGAAPPPATIDAGTRDAAVTHDATADAEAEIDDAAVSPVDAGSDGCVPAADLDELQIQTTELGELAVPDLHEPRAGPAVRIGQRVLWTFWVDGWSHGVWTDVPAEPLTATPALQAPAPPVPLLPAVAVPVNMTASIGGAVAVSETEALIYFSSFYILQLGQVGLARVGLDATQAEVIHAAGELFRHPPPVDPQAPPPWRPRFYAGALVHAEPDDTYVYVYACDPNPAAPDELPGGASADPCRLARAPIAQASDGAAYRYWNGEDWDSNVDAARAVMDGVPGRLSVSYNAYLERFLAVHTAGASSRVTLRWADRPEGPFHPLGQFETLPANGAYGFTFEAIEQPALRDECHRTLFVTYTLPLAPTEPGGPDVFESRLVRVELE